MFNKIKFSQILKKINSTYSTMTEFAKKADFDRTYISKYINLKLDNPPTPKILEKISNASNNTTTYPELMEICGYIDSKKYYMETYNIPSLTYDNAMGFNLFKNLSDEEANIFSNMLMEMNNKKSKYIINGHFDVRKYLNIYDNSIQNNIIDNYNLMIKSQNNIFSTIIKTKDSSATKEDTNSLSANSAVVLIYGTIPAGIPMECIEDIIDTEEIDADMLKGGKQYFGLKIKGNSMFPEYLDNDTIILEKVEDVESGTDAVVMVNGDDGTFKRVFKNENGIILQPLNPEYTPMVYTNEQIEKLPVRIIGKVVELRRKK